MPSHLSCYCQLTPYFPMSTLTAQGPVVQSVVSPIADPGVMSLIPARSHTFVEIDHEILSTIILLLPLIQEE